MCLQEGQWLWAWECLFPRRTWQAQQKGTGPLGVLAGKVGSSLIYPPFQSHTPEHRLQKCKATQQLLDVHSEPGAKLGNQVQSLL